MYNRSSGFMLIVVRYNVKTLHGINEIIYLYTFQNCIHIGSFIYITNYVTESTKMLINN